MSDSSSDSDCFESADEELNDDISIDDIVKCSKLKNDSGLIDSFSLAGDDESPIRSESKKEGNPSESRVQYRKRPERRKNMPVPVVDMPDVRQISINDQVFKPPNIKPDVLIQDITANLSKNLNIGFNTFHQTSSSIKDLVMSSLPVKTPTENSTRFSYDDEGEEEEEEEIASYLPDYKKDCSQDECDKEISNLPSTCVKDSFKLEEKELQPCLQFSENETESVVETKKLSDNVFEDMSLVSKNTNTKFTYEETIENVLQDDVEESEDLKCFDETNDSFQVLKKEMDQQVSDLDFNIEANENEKVEGDEIENIMKDELEYSNQEINSHNVEFKSEEIQDDQEGLDGNNDGWDTFDLQLDDLNIEESPKTNLDKEEAKIKDTISPGSENEDAMLENPTSNSNEGWDDFDFDEEEELGVVETEDQKPKPLKQCEVNEISRYGLSSNHLKFGTDETENVCNNNKWSGWDNFGEKQETKQKSGWTLSNWGVNALLNTATSVTQGLSTVLEAGLGAPDPETLAKMEMESIRENNENRSQQKETLSPTKSEEPANSSIKLFPDFGITNLVAGVTKNIVEHTKVHEIGSKVISGGLDTLESFGKKTMEVLQEGDPGLKKKRALLLGTDKPTLSHVLREAKEKAEMEEQQKGKLCHFETLFDDFKGLAHLEALEMLSRQCELKLERLRESLSTKELEDMNDTLDEVKELCVIDEDEFKTSYYGVADFKISLKKVTESLKNEISVQKIIQVHEEYNAWLKSEEGNVKSSISLFEKAMSVLAALTAATVQQFHKGGELLSVKEHRKTVEEADALLQMTGVVCGEIDRIKEKFMKLCTSEVSDIDAGIQKKIKEESVNATMYIKDAFNLLIPVIQLGATS